MIKVDELELPETEEEATYLKLMHADDYENRILQYLEHFVNMSSACNITDTLNWLWDQRIFPVSYVRLGAAPGSAGSITIRFTRTKVKIMIGFEHRDWYYLLATHASNWVIRDMDILVHDIKNES
jgi:hypothetical protein